MEAALDYFQINVAGLTCLDAGLSTGGFTDCLLQNGATKVYGVDVGHGQVCVQAEPLCPCCLSSKAAVLGLAYTSVV